LFNSKIEIENQINTLVLEHITIIDKNSFNICMVWFFWQCIVLFDYRNSQKRPIL